MHFQYIYCIARQSYLNKVALKIEEDSQSIRGKKGPEAINLGKTKLWKSGNSVCEGQWEVG